MRRRFPRSISRASAVLAVLLLAGLAWGQAPPKTRTAKLAKSPRAARLRIDRLVGLCRAWNAAKYFSPALWSGKIDWDSAFVSAASEVDGTLSKAAFWAVAAKMLGRLDDSGTEVRSTDEVDGDPPVSSKPSAKGGQERELPLTQRVGRDLLMVNIAGVLHEKGPYAFGRLGTQLQKALPRARGAIFDLRYRNAADSSWGGSVLDAMAPFFVPAKVNAPLSKWIVYWGYRPQRGTSSGGFHAGLVTSPVRSFVPADGGGDWRLVFLINQETELNSLVKALVEGGKAKLVSDGDFDSWRESGSTEIPLGEGLIAQVRTGDEQGEPLPVKIVQNTRSDTDKALMTAESLLEGPWQETPAGSGEVENHLVRHTEQTYPNPPFPSLGKRLLAGCRAWGVVHYFYPYINLIGDWTEDFRESLPALISAGDEDAYVRALLTLLAHVEDGHTMLWGQPAVWKILGEARPQFMVQIVQDQVAVSAVAPGLKGISVGDVIVAVDGESIAARMKRLRALIPAATDEDRRWRTAVWALGGPAGSTAVLEVRGSDGKLRRVTVLRHKGYWWPPLPKGTPWKLLSDRIGYVDLQRLQRSQVGTMLDDLRATDALILDLRGYPKGTAWPLAARLNSRGAKVGALISQPEVSDFDIGERSDKLIRQPLPSPTSWTYRGQVVVLINDEAMSQAEHTALFLEQAAGATFIGSPTAGTDGDITSFPLPGGLWVTMTGNGVRHADGRQLQRLGIQPDVLVRPTLRGLREGKDEVLEAALRWLRDNRKATPPTK